MAYDSFPIKGSQNFRIKYTNAHKYNICLYIKVSLFIYLHVNFALQNVTVTFNNAYGWLQVSALTQALQYKMPNFNAIVLFNILSKENDLYRALAWLGQRLTGLNIKTKQQDSQVLFFFL